MGVARRRFLCPFPQSRSACPPHTAMGPCQQQSLFPDGVKALSSFQLFRLHRGKALFFQAFLSTVKKSLRRTHNHNRGCAGRNGHRSTFSLVRGNKYTYTRPILSCREKYFLRIEKSRMSNNRLFSLDDAPTFSPLRAQDPSPLARFSTLCTQDSSLCAPVRYYSPGIRGAQVESVRGWRAQAKSLHSAGIESNRTRVLISFYRCDVCGIHIGPGYYEQTMYLYPVRKQSLNCIDGPPQYFESSWLKVCGGCAHDRRRMVPQWLCVLTPLHWSTTLLLCREGETPTATDMTDRVQMTSLRRAIDAYVTAFYQYVFSVLLFSLDIPLTAVYAPTASTAPQTSPQHRPKTQHTSPLALATTKGTDGGHTKGGAPGETGEHTTLLQFPVERARHRRPLPASLRQTYQIAQ